MFVDPETGKPYEYIKRPWLRKTLEEVATGGADVLYGGKLTQKFVKDIRDNGGIITEDDMTCYKPEWKTPIQMDLPCGQTLYTSPLPGCGLVLALILNILQDFLDLSHPSSTNNFSKIVESFKFAFGQRTKLADLNFADFSTLIRRLTSVDYARTIRELVPTNQTCQDPTFYGAKTTGTIISDATTANICVVAPNGDAVVATSSINFDWGAGFMSKSTGIILNNTMDDFSSPTILSGYRLPPSRVNFIQPGKRPLSSMCPSIILDKNGDVEMVVGAAGGPKIITSIALVIIKHLWFDLGLQEAVSSQRFHHQLFPMKIQFEQNMDLVDALHELGHDYEIQTRLGFNAVTAISRKSGTLEAAFDPRRGGQKDFVL
ncbi:hypothetical protein Zmor_022352 [Zophobas morio]|uniref:Gamma-glutamyltranspeptidase 1 n=1 Tax=Zophobas morio TaxID=2755281 RepID=A0AA38HV47_9CUCU|nr:hypothetical protein Zmor_022352 [Zophobas morio]